MTQFAITLTRAQLRAALIFAADKDVRYYLNGVCLEVGECGDARLVATDGHRLAVLAVGDHPAAVPGEYLIPRDVLKPIKRASRTTGADVSIMIDGGRVMVAAGTEIIAGGLLIDGKFPDWQRVCPDPERMSGEPGTYNAQYVADIAGALIELGDRCPAFDMLQQGQTGPGLVIDLERGLMVATMPMRGNGFVPTRSARDHFLPRRPVFSAVVETAAGGQAFPCDPLQDVSDKRAPAAIEPAAPAPREIVNGYEARQAARREHYATLADKMRTASAMHYSASRRAVEHIPFGQPILVGHHSERGHRATLARAHRAMDRSCEAAGKADHYAQRAASVGNGGISSDDPAALVKLRAEHTRAEQLQQTMKECNKAIRANKTPEAQAAALVALGMSESQAAALLKPDFMGRAGFPDYRIKNNGANIRRIAGRIAELETRRQAEDVERIGACYIYREDVDENRVMFEFSSKPAEAVRDILKNSGFRWSPSRGAWVRQLNNAGRWHAQDAARRIDAINAADQAGEVTASGEAEAAPTPAPEPGTTQASGEDEARAALAHSGERLPKIQTVERRDCTGRAWLALAGVPKGCDSLHPLQYGAHGIAQARAAKLRADGIAATVRGRGPYMIEVDPSGEVVAEACPTLIPGRWIPGEAENAERIAFDASLGAEVWLIASTARAGALAVIAYAGKRTKHDAHYTMRDRAQALQWAGEYMGKQQAAAQRQADQRAENAAKRAAGHKLKPGDVLRCSWGYDQTNIDYYEVTRLIGARMVEIRKIGAESVNSSNMTGECVPRPGHYIGEPMRKAVSDYDGQSVRIASYASAHKIEPREVGGVKVYPVDHWTAYA